MPSERIVAVGLLTERDLDLLGPTFQRLWPIESAPQFTELLKTIDEADRELHEGSSEDTSQDN
ncbi:MAG TPA: hypothetical protein VFW39_06280 [Sphingomicrobium sp.]|nr:hypothetical protein [Sphingomicrobium sp.]